MSSVVPASAESITQAANLLREGKLVAFPTETVYGLGADATNDRAVAAIYAAKGRPQFNPLIIHFADIKALQECVVFDDRAALVASQFMPGPLTLVLPRKITANTSLLASAGMDTLAVRIPSHPVARELLEKVGLPIAAPSANASGKLSPTTPVHVAQSLGDKVDMILAGGKSRIGLESTVLSLAGPQPLLLRHGAITREQIEKLIGPIDVFNGDNNANPQSPGLLTSHYAPNAPLRLNTDSISDGEALLAFGPAHFLRGGAMRLNLSETGDLEEAAANLFAMLHQLDKPEHKTIAVMPIPMTGLGAAINDRLARAAKR